MFLLTSELIFFDKQPINYTITEVSILFFKGMKETTPRKDLLRKINDEKNEKKEFVKEIKLRRGNVP